MSAAGLVWVALISTACAVAGLVLVILVSKAARGIREGRRERRAVRVRPVVLGILTSEDGDGTEALDAAVARLSPADGRAVVTLACELLPKVRGDAHAALVDLLIQRGVVARARRRSCRCGATGRAFAAKLLGETGTRSAYRDLVRLLGDRDADVRLVAARALGRLGRPTAVPALLDRMAGPRALPAGVVAQSLMQLGPAAVQPLRAALSARCPEVRSLAAGLLGHLSHPSAAADLVALLENDADDDVRLRSADALGQLGHPLATDALVAALSPHEPAGLRRAAAVALARLGAEDGVGALGEALSSDDHVVAHAAAAALLEAGAEGHAALRMAAGSATTEAGLTGAAHAREALALEALVRARSASRARAA